jgi:hypothetical protein
VFERSYVDLHCIMVFFRNNAILVQLIGVDDKEDDEKLH